MAGEAKRGQLRLSTMASPESTMRPFLILGALALLAGCATSNDDHPALAEPLPAPMAEPAPAASAPAQAPTVAGTGWQYARWGMSPDQVVAASGGQAVLARQDSRTNTVFGSTAAEANYRQ